MKNTLTIARRQFASYFNGPVAYIVICVVLLAFGFLFWRTFFLYQVASMRAMVQGPFSLPFIMTIALPALTMGLIAEEKRTGTIELLLTMPVRESEVIFGKFLGVLGLFTVLLLLTIPYPLSVASLGNLDAGPVISLYVGVFLLGAAMLAIGLMFSSFTENQIIAFFAALATCFTLWLLGKVLMFTPAGLTDIFEFLAFDSHLETMSRGVIDTRNLIYFVSLTAFALMFAFRGLEKRRWS